RDTRPQLWAMRGEERERLGTCVAGLYLVGYDGLVDTLEGRQHCYTFTKYPPSAASPSAHGRGTSDADDGSGIVSKADGSISNGDRQNVAGGDGCGSSSLLRSALGEGEMGLLGLEGMHANIARII
ncbi:hypothetical protein DUNSADRAFT_11078, partial [Dunaliella salina]